MSTGSLRDMEAGEEAKAMDISPMEQEATVPEAPAIEEPPSPPREGKCADQQAQRGEEVCLESHSPHPNNDLTEDWV